MSAPTLSIDVHAVDELRHGDEQALQRIFRESYAELITEAKSHLDDDDGAAARVVESAFVRVWEQHGSFQSADVLNVFLHSAVREGAVRERSRRAALRRFENNEKVHSKRPAANHAPSSVDEAWQHLDKAIHPAAPALNVEEMKSHSRHEAAAHVASLGTQRAWIKPVLGVIAAAAVLSAGGWWLSRAGEDVAITQALASLDAKILTAASGQLAIVTLDDGTKVKLAPFAKLRIPPKFTSFRAVKLEGNAEFTVSPGQKLPLEIRAGNSSIRSTGGVLDVLGDSTGFLLVRSRDSAVSVRSGKEYQPLAKGAALMQTAAGATSTPSNDALVQAFSWTDGQVTLINRPLRDVLTELRRWYGLELYLKDATILDRPVTLTASLDSPRDAITALEKGANVVFGWEGKNMILTDGGKK